MIGINNIIRVAKVDIRLNFSKQRDREQLMKELKHITDSTKLIYVPIGLVILGEKVLC